MAGKIIQQTPWVAKVSLAVTAGSTCACGQALDLSHTAHCPRCGITLRAA
jgi:hypothetical protein